MTAPPRILVIHRQVDADRQAFVENHYHALNLPFEFLDAVNGHNLAELAPFCDLIGDDFWGENKIKAGALACFLSHRLAWIEIAKGEHAVIVSEDDSAPVEAFIARWEKAQAALENCDFLFLNNRMARWARSGFEPLDAVLGNFEAIEQSAFRAPGGDGYLLTPKAAEFLLEEVDRFKITCGVDWFMLACLRQNRSIAHPPTKEFAYISEHFGAGRSTLKALVAKPPLFKIDRKIPSSIRHKDQVNISTLKTELARLTPN